MKNRKVKESPLFEVKKEEIIKYYNFIYAYILDLKRRKGSNVSNRHKAAVREPGWASSEILYLALYGYTKKTKFSKGTQYLSWKTIPKTFEKRVLSLLGPDVRKFIMLKENEILNVKDSAAPEGPVHVNTLSYDLRTDSQEVLDRMQKYIEDYDLHSAVDIDILKNLVQTQILIESAHKKLTKGEHTAFDLKDLSVQLKNYTTLLGLSKKDRLDLGAERKRGSIGELATIYEETLKEYPELEQEFFLEELNMLLDKHERLTEDGERELSSKSFKIISGGYTLEEAFAITDRRRKNAKQPKNR
jgi:hypothetical protein